MRSEVMSVNECVWPESWLRIKLAEAGQWLSGGTPSTSNEAYWGGDIPWISAASLKSFRIAGSDRRLTRLGVANGSRLVGEGVALFVVRGMSLKSEFRIGVAEREVAFGQDCKALIPANGIDPYFLAYAIRVRTPEILSMVEETSHGTGRLDTARLQELEIGVPPIAEQHRIVAAHAACERRIEAIERVLDKVAIAETALISRAAAGTRKRVELGAWLKRIEAGKSPLAQDTPAGDGEWGVLKVSAVQRGWFNSTENKVVRDFGHIDPQFEVRSGDLLMTRANTEDLVGLACIARTPSRRLMLSDKTLRLVVDPSLADPEFVELMLLDSVVRGQVKSAATGTSGSMKNIGQAAIRGLLVPDVPLVDQRKVVAVRAASQAWAAGLRKKLAKLLVIQLGLSQNLLSGTVRV